MLYGELFEVGRIYVVLFDWYMIVCGGDLWLFDMVVENFVCLVVDLLFCFVVCEYGVGVIGVVFSGDFDDGVVGLVVICVWGGYGIV